MWLHGNRSEFEVILGYIEVVGTKCLLLLLLPTALQPKPGRDELVYV
jgi:hypothetical protein